MLKPAQHYSRLIFFLNWTLDYNSAVIFQLFAHITFVSWCGDTVVVKSCLEGLCVCVDIGIVFTQAKWSPDRSYA